MKCYAALCENEALEKFPYCKDCGLKIIELCKEYAEIMSEIRRKVYSRFYGLER